MIGGQNRIFGRLIRSRGFMPLGNRNGYSPSVSYILNSAGQFVEYGNIFWVPPKLGHFREYIAQVCRIQVHFFKTHDKYK